LSSSQALKPEEDFTAGEAFVFTPLSTPEVGRLTRSRRSSMMLTTLPPVPESAGGRRRSLAPAPSSQGKAAPSLKITRRSKLTDSDILARLDEEAEKSVETKSKKNVATKIASQKKIIKNVDSKVQQQLAKSPGKGMKDSEILAKEEIKDVVRVNKTVSVKTERKVERRRSLASISAGEKKVEKRVEKKQPVVKSPRKTVSRIPVKSPPVTADITDQLASRAAPRKTRTSARRLSLALDPPQPRKASRAPLEIPTAPLAAVPEEKVEKMETIVADVRKVQVSLRKVKQKEDPNVIFNLLEKSVKSPDRVKIVVEQILHSSPNKAPVTRKRQSETEQGEPAATTKTETPSRSKRRRLETTDTSQKAEETEEIEQTTKTMMATPSEAQTRSPAIVKLSTRKASVSPLKKTPTPLLAQYKQKTPGSLKKPLKRLTAKSTPAAVRPSALLRHNLKKQVETAISSKLGTRPDSSPYTLQGEDDGSPQFERVTAEPRVHLTGTPARPARQRKFGTVLQPASLLEQSLVAPPTEVRRQSSSTPLRPGHAPHPHAVMEEATPIKAVQCSPAPMDCPASPPPEMVTGGLAKLCIIM